MKIPSIDKIRLIDRWEGHGRIPEHTAVEIREILAFHADKPLQGMNAVNSLLRAHGVERICNTKTGTTIHYVNLGDTYSTTLLLRNRQSWSIGSWGDIVERGGNWA